jgi:hypothetical protein
MGDAQPSSLSTSGWLLALSFIAFLTVVSILVLVIFRPPTTDNLPLITTIIGIVTPLMVGVMGKILADMKVVVEETKAEVNGQMAQFRQMIVDTAKVEVSKQLQTSHDAGRAEGMLEQQRLSLASTVAKELKDTAKVEAVAAAKDLKDEAKTQAALVIAEAEKKSHSS